MAPRNNPMVIANKRTKKTDVMLIRSIRSRNALTVSLGRNVGNKKTTACSSIAGRKSINMMVWAALWTVGERSEIRMPRLATIPDINKLAERFIHKISGW